VYYAYYRSSPPLPAINGGKKRERGEHSRGRGGRERSFQLLQSLSSAAGLKRRGGEKGPPRKKWKRRRKDPLFSSGIKSLFSFHVTWMLRQMHTHGERKEKKIKKKTYYD